MIDDWSQYADFCASQKQNCLEAKLDTRMQRCFGASEIVQKTPMLSGMGVVDLIVPFSTFFKAIGIKLSVARMWRARHNLPVLIIGRSLYISCGDDQEWLLKHRNTTPVRPNREDERTEQKPFAKSSIATRMKKIY